MSDQGLVYSSLFFIKILNKRENVLKLSDTCNVHDLLLTFKILNAKQNQISGGKTSTRL